MGFIPGPGGQAANALKEASVKTIVEIKNFILAKSLSGLRIMLQSILSYKEHENENDYV